MGRGPINLLKVDVEGYVLYVFRGAEKRLLETQCVYFESNEQHFAKFGYSCSDVFRYLCLRGFTMFKFPSEDTLQKIGENYRSDVNENIVGVRDIDYVVDRTGLSIGKVRAG